MPFAGVGLHVIIAIFFAVHAVRTGQNNYWLFVLLAFPFLGSLVYLLAVYLPSTRLERGARKLAVTAMKALDPKRELRDAQAAYDYSPTAQNEIRLAQALLAAGQAALAVKHFEASMKGPFANDLEIRWGAAQAAFEAGQPQAALQHLRTIAQTDVQFRAEQVGVLTTKAYAASGDADMAQKSFEFVHQNFGSFDVMAEYAIWCAQAGNWTKAEQLEAEMSKAQTNWGSQQRELNRETLRRVKTAFAARTKS